MPARGVRRNHKLPRKQNATDRPMSKTATWLSAPIGVAVIVGLAAAASFAQSTTAVFIAASLVFSLCEGVVLAVVGYTWSRRGLTAAVLAAGVTAAVAAPLRWEVSLMRFAQPVQQMDLLTDLLVSIAWGALAGLAGATILRPRLAVLMRDNRP
jgi:hypothetical protein